MWLALTSNDSYEESSILKQIYAYKTGTTGFFKHNMFIFKTFYS